MQIDFIGSNNSIQTIRNNVDLPTFLTAVFMYLCFICSIFCEINYIIIIYWPINKGARLVWRSDNGITALVI